YGLTPHTSKTVNTCQSNIIKFSPSVVLSRFKPTSRIRLSGYRTQRLHSYFTSTNTHLQSTYSTSNSTQESSSRVLPLTADALWQKPIPSQFNSHFILTSPPPIHTYNLHTAPPILRRNLLH